MIKSLRNQLVLALCVLVSIIGVVQGVSSYQLSKAGMSALLDLRLEQVAGRMRGGFADSLPAIPARGSQPERDIVITVWRDDQATPYRSTEPSLALPREAPAGFVTTAVGGDEWRIYTLREPSMVIQVAQRSAVRHELAQDRAVNTLWPMIVLVPLVWIAVLLVVRGSLRKLNRLGAQVQGIDVSHFQQLSTSGVPIEIRPFIDSINLMIDRLAQSIESERKFISDAAHELRTPLTALQLQADNLQPHIAPGNQERFCELRSGITRSGGLIAQLLRLARADAALQADTLTRVDVPAVVVDAVAEVLPIAMKRGIDIGADEMASAFVRAVEADVSIAVRNLVSNAIRYTPDGGKVDLSVQIRDDRVWIDVTDTGPGIAEELLPRVFDRFFRANTQIEGSGLGLSIVKAIASKYGGAASLRNRRDGPSGIVASIGFPSAS
ncbi:ATP-binding protein [Caballeronia mineralivorans]|jgi:two-component system OmpR family sensor kinase|uniref:ATP-binding protein n=1 Tax=Caballeronia mineralivorans TaxID=2010198 RepID=UPI0023EFC906|nr:ATP-binding protein [Caballeronia mineralivorans]MDB5785111.1 integral rane sensor signal transduction histidine kinase [Caballeronia mineralivorans]MEA3097441.1 two-component system, OmpR family, sensor kinase [Caballeronia mineralivorans]